MKKLTDISKDFPGWYQDVIFKAELVDSSPTRGSMVIMPYGYAIWENMQKIVNEKIGSLGAKNAYFPLLIPESFLKKEAEHVEGFAPEVAVVTHAGGKKLEEPLVIRPTSETIIYYMFARWIKSWRDLPLKINQWANVVRWEMRPRAFLRTTEFLWQEGHTAHATKDEANKMTLDAQEMYRDFMENYLAIPIIKGIKTPSERFAGAEETYCLEAIMPDGKALQMGTSHLLSENFPASFEIAFQDKDGTQKTPRCTSWGATTRMIGGLLMTHGDEFGLVIPPKIAPIQIVIVPIIKKKAAPEDEGTDPVMELTEKIAQDLKNKHVRVEVDTDQNKTPGAKFFHWELKGVPLRIEIGPKDVEKGTVVLALRHEHDKEKKKQFVPVQDIEKVVIETIETMQKTLLERARKKVEKMIQDGDKLENFASALEKEKVVFRSGWCGSPECEAKLKQYKGSIRCITGKPEQQSSCFACEKESTFAVIIAKSY